MSAFEQLDPLVQHHIVNTLGWRSLRPMQEACIEPIQQGEHCLVLAPTAGGKTEAASFPVLSRICKENWTGLSVLYICPLKALLNNLLPRLEEYCRMVGRRCGLWHGDIAASRRQRILGEPPDILLTTPESLEVLLISSKEEGRAMLKGVRTVIVDEIHAFAGDDRGWHLLAVLERIGHLAGRELQRIGLSATVGNPGQLLDWLAGQCEGQRRVIQPPEAGMSSTESTEVQLDYVGSLANAAIVISRLYRGQKRLVFCDSRSRVEELGNELRRLGVSVFLSHSSLSVEQRRDSEQAFAEAQDCVIVATSTLELGIDVGDLDRVIQIDAPGTVASFLQRIGRTGRRQGSVRNCLFLATSTDSLLKAAGLLALWQGGFVEPVIPPLRPLHLFAQQMMALALQEKGIGQRDWRSWMGRLPWVVAESDGVLEGVLSHLQQEAYLFSDGARWSMGGMGEEAFGRRHFLELVSVFTSDPVFKVLHGQQELGTVDPLTFLRQKGKEPQVLSLGGRSWEVSSIDWPKRTAHVIQVEGKGKSQWQGGRQGLAFPLVQAIHGVLVSDEVSGLWTQRAREALAEHRESYSFLRAGVDVLLEDGKGYEVRWMTFAGLMVNTALADALRAAGWQDVAPSDVDVRISDTSNAQDLLKSIESLTPEGIRETFQVSEEFLDQLKFNECLPQSLAQDILKARWILPEMLGKVLNKNRQRVAI